MLVYFEFFVILAGAYVFLFREQFAGRVRDDHLIFALEFGAVCLMAVAVACQGVLEWSTRLTMGGV